MLPAIVVVVQLLVSTVFLSSASYRWSESVSNGEIGAPLLAQAHAPIVPSNVISAPESSSTLAASGKGDLDAAHKFDPPHAIDRFEPAIKKFEESDKSAMPAPGSTLFVGSSTFTHWKNLEDEFKDLKAVNRGFGGSTIAEVNHYLDRIVINYKPARIVFYAGTNDVAEGHTPVQIFADFAQFIEKVHQALPETQIYFISMSVAPSRLQWQQVYDESNQLVCASITGLPYAHYINVLPAMRDSEGKLRQEYFGADRLHMNASGYAAWIPILRKALGKPDGQQL